MSLASCSYQCTWVGDGMTFTVSLLGSQGDLFQRYSDSALTPSSVTPNWDNLAAGSRPFIRILLMESDPDISEATLAGYVSDANTKWYVDGKQIVFNNSGISIDGSGADELTGYAGCFRKLTAAAGTAHLTDAPFGGLEICKNLVTPSNGQNIQVSAVVALSVDGKTAYVQGSTAIKMIKSVGSSNFCSIYCDAADSFVLDEDNADVVCKVNCWQGDTQLTTFYRKWYLLEGGAWVQKATTDTFTVDRDMIDTFGDVKVECYSDSSRTKLIASDIQTINDAADPYILSPNPNPADGVFYAANPTGNVSFTPKVTDADGNTVAVAGYRFTVMDSVGNIINSDSTTVFPQNTAYTLPWSMANAIKEGPLVVITAEG